ncbi:CopY/TcrY family copper transport repressor [Limosilactobacillus caviae]|uniref:Uracil phosphoribosyltransferase n=1 Tax=Limosilactobacillus caviae TaxID=1769424 RepID=A0ABQ2C552_9LACO|nr:CopY/TcrY family copper transport repressor [Limosilactobacillus caviae]MCD7124457.1 CopY/TcrY family copper transport repressor [Limosilactobacillus caviae]MRH45762.1 CopY/TcrY family copper transport repressor [Limosilactobacillus reuteri]GGI63062.1 uracil phosphoribosyltransferase [Limosilactobacillus caviae]
MNSDLEITPAEWQVMRVVWSLRQTTSSRIIEILQQKVEWKPATIKTLLRRLVDKEALSATRQGRGFIYEPLVPEQQTMDQAADNLFNNICERHVGSTLEHVINNATLSKDDIASLQKLLASKVADSPDNVKCNCIPHMQMKC